MSITIAPVADFVLSQVAAMSPQQREDFYLIMACKASDNGHEDEADQWLFHAEHRTNSHTLKTYAFKKED